MWAQSSHRLIFLIAGTVLVLVVVGFLSQPFGESHPLSNAAPANANDPTKFTSAATSTPTLAPIEDVPVIPIASAGDSEISDNGILILHNEHEAQEHYVVSSAGLGQNGHWFELEWKDYTAYNLNMLPHPTRNDTYIMIAQAGQGSFDEPDSHGGPVYSLEMICTARIIDGKMQCEKSPLNLPVASTASTHCVGEGFEWFNWLIGPSDARVFMGPEGIPYIIYVSASHHGCLGPWIHDLRRLVRFYDFAAVNQSNLFFYPTELDRPAPRGMVEKNWFAFWDKDGAMYAHYDVSPQRSFARLNADGSVGENLAPLATRDDQCLQRYLPKTRPKEHIHQATNSLAITLCKRNDPSCQNETYIMTVFHHKLYYGHNLYEPYIMLFKQEAPFDLHAIASKPFWISGRGKPGEKWSTDPNMPTDQSQMMFMVSMNWKYRGLNYHGYLDDELIISFGVEDRRSGAIDVVAGDLVRELSLCDG